MKTFDALTTGVSVAIDDDVPLREVALAIIAAYPPAGSARLHYHLRAHEVLRDGRPLALDDAGDIVPLFEMDLYEQVVARANPGWILHAAALEVNGRALVLCGPSGAGKTTLTLALAARGFRLLTEEVVWIDRRAVVRGLPRPIHMPPQSEHVSRIPTDWAQLRYPIRDRQGALRENTLVLPATSAFCMAPLPLHAIVRIGHGAGWAAHLQPSPHHIALQRLWDRSLRQDDGGLAAATDVLREHGSYELSSTSVPEALGLLETLLK